MGYSDEEESYYSIPRHWSRAYRNKEYQEEKHEGHHGLEHHNSKEEAKEKHRSVFHYF